MTPASRLRTWAVLLGLALLPGTLALANLRAAIYRDLGASGALRPVPGLVVVSERLDFTFEGVFRDPRIDGLHPTHLCKVEAVYQVRSEGEHPAILEFIAPSAQDATARINGVAAELHSTVFQDDQRVNLPWHQGPRERLTLAFQGTLRPGANEIAVTYTQPLSSRELGLRYFHRPRWRTSAEYEFWPIKEWTRAPWFRAEVTLSIPRPTGLGEFFFGPSILIGGTSQPRQRTQEPAPLPCTLGKTPDRLLAHFTFAGEDLPDLLEVMATEKD